MTPAFSLARTSAAVRARRRRFGFACGELLERVDLARRLLVEVGGLELERQHEDREELRVEAARRRLGEVEVGARAAAA